MIRKILFYGLIAGLLVGIPMVAETTLISDRESMRYGMLIGYLTMLIALSTVFVAIKRHRDESQGGVIGFWPAFGLGLGISAVAGVIYVAAWEIAQSLAHMDFATDYAKALIAHKRDSGASAEALAKLTVEMERFKVQYANPLYRLPMTFAEIFPVGVLVSLVSAALLRSGRFMPRRSR